MEVETLEFLISIVDGMGHGCDDHPAPRARQPHHPHHPLGSEAGSPCALAPRSNQGGSVFSFLSLLISRWMDHKDEGGGK